MGEIKITEKSTKAQILEAYNQALKELEALKAMNDSPIETAKNEALRASLKNAETAAKNSVFSEEIIKQYKDLKIAIDEYKKELESLYGIKTEADSLAAIINAHKFKIADMDTEYKKLKDMQCPNCHKAGHDENAAYCKYCGFPLHKDSLPKDKK